MEEEIRVQYSQNMIAVVLLDPEYFSYIIICNVGPTENELHCITRLLAHLQDFS